MTIEENGAAEAVTEPSSTPDTSTETVEANAIEETPRGAIDRAFEAVEAQDAAPEKSEKPSEIDSKKKRKAMDKVADELNAEKSAGKPERNPDGTFKSKADEKAAGEQEASPDTNGQKDDKPAPESFNEAPNRFSPDAKEVWKDAPLPVRAEIHRMEREFNAGIEQYKGDAEAFDEYRPFAEHLQKTGQNFGDVVNHYVGLENLLAEDPFAGFEQIARNIGTDLQSVAAAVMGQSPDERTQSHNAEIGQLRDEIRQLQGQLGGVTTSIADQQTAEATRELNAFKADNTRFDELAPNIAKLMKAGVVANLQEAYAMAERLNPAAATAKETEPAHTRSDETAHPRKTQLSVDGGPSKGSSRADRKSPDTARDAIDNAFAEMGLG